MVQGCLSPRGGGEAWRWTEKGPGDTPCAASPHPSRERWQRSFPPPPPSSPPFLGEGRSPWQPARGGERGRDAACLLLAAFLGKASLKPRWVPRWGDRIEERGPV